jgi:hypothetical protein
VLAVALFPYVMATRQLQLVVFKVLRRSPTRWIRLLAFLSINFQIWLETVLLRDNLRATHEVC